jgi:hypothetical protein
VYAECLYLIFIVKKERLYILLCTEYIRCELVRLILKICYENIWKWERGGKNFYVIMPQHEWRSWLQENNKLH